ncbi:MAG: LemA family protein [Candidatus Omnitrophica bacterium]|nr:LemA family protein [Candidatus Omnitrophota bacterium]
MVRMSETIKKMFPRDFEELSPVKKHWWQKIDFNNLKTTSGIILTVCATALILLGIYYYNKFIALSRFTEMEQHQIDVQLQRRKDIFINLTNTIIAYAQHERAMFQYMADSRDGGPDPMKSELIMDVLQKNGLTEVSKLKGKSLDTAISKVLALAEAYPQLKLSENFQIQMQGIIRSEDLIAERRMAYNEAASHFHAYVRKIPACFYAFIFGYKEKMFHYAEVDEDVREYNRVTY